MENNQDMNQENGQNQPAAQEPSGNTEPGQAQYTDPNSGYENPNSGYQNANSGYGNPNSGYQNQNNGYSYQNNGYSYQNNGYSYQNGGYQYQDNSSYNAGGNPGGYYQSGNNYENGMDTSPMSMGEWMLTILIMLIPCVNIVMYLIWAFSKTGNLNRRNYCRAFLIFYLIILVLTIIFSVVFGFAAATTYTYY